MSLLDRVSSIIRADDEPIDAVRRWLGLLASICGLALAAVATPYMLRETGSFPAGVMAMQFSPFLLNLVALGAGFVAPIRYLRLLWIGYAVTLFAVVVIWFAFPGSIVMVLPGVWLLQAAAVASVYASANAPTAIVYSVVLAFAPPLASLCLNGAIPAHLAAVALAHLSNVIFVPLLAALAGRLLIAFRLARAEQETLARLAAAEASAEQRRLLAAVVHDEVLATLTAARLLDGAPHVVLRSAAADAMAALGQAEARTRWAPVSAEQVAAEIAARLSALDPTAALTLRVDPAAVMLPAEVARALPAAAAESFRNSLRHAGADARRRVTIDAGPDAISIAVNDDGVGFDENGIDADRLGIRNSILGRMNDVRGSGAVHSAPGRGTTVEISWRQP